MTAKKAASLFLLFALLLLPSITALAQGGTTGRIAGTVKDENGDVIAGAEVSIVSKATGAQRKANTDADGNFAATPLPAGPYRVRVAANGFKALDFEVEVVITQTTTLNVDLPLAGLIDTVVVRIAPLIQRDGPQLGRVVDSRAVSELPLATRNFTQILGLSPGTAVALPDNSALGRNTQNISVNGARATQNNYQLNGVDANRLGVNAANTLAVPAPETIQEFKVQTSLYDATFGRSGGGNVQAVTRSGGNDLHGSLYEYFRNDALNANNPFLKAAGVSRPVLTRNIFGGVLGGPIKADKLFFFGSYQGARERNGGGRSSLSQSILVDPKLTNDRSAATLQATYNLASINPVALALLNVKLSNGKFLIPTPQLNGRYSGSAISTYREDQFNTNTDYRINERDWLAVKCFFSNAPQNRALGPNDGANIPGVALDQEQNNRLVSMQETHTFSSTMINEARLGYNFVRQDNFPQGSVRDSDLGITRANANAFPGLGLIRIGGAGSVTIGTGPGLGDVQNAESSSTFDDTLSITRGRHSVRTGAEIIYYQTNIRGNSSRRGQININSFTEFLQGVTANSVYGDGIGERSLRATDYDFFVQDDWKMSRKLTLNLGLRYELDLPPYDTRGRIPTFDASLYEPSSLQGPPVGGLVLPENVIAQYDIPTLPKVGKRVLKSNDPNNFAPRIGFAFSPLDSGRLVLRGGYGIFYSRASTIYISFSVPPIYLTRRQNAATLANPYLPVPLQGQFPVLVPGIPLSSNVFDRDMRTPYLQQYNTGVQYAVSKDLVLEVAYVGTRGLNLLRPVAINQAQLASLQQPIINAVTGQVITTNSVANVGLRAPFQGVDISGFNQIQSTAQSTYDSLQVSLTKRLTRGLQFLASYTFAKSIDNASGQDTFDTFAILGNQLDDRANRGVSDFDRTHRFVLSYLWDLPRPAFAARSSAERLLFSNWQMAAIVTAMSGLPIDVVDSTAGSLYLGTNNGLSRPNWAPDNTLSTATSNIPAGYFFNPFAFSRPTVLAGQLIPSSNGTATASATGTDFGNVGRNVLRGPLQTNVDFSIIKRFPFGESKNVEVRAEFFNLLNHVNFANPISNLNAFASSGGSIDSNTGQIINPGDFGRITSTSNNARLIQFALKLNF
jgi:Carboxypeptidase regulatory-like domain/TonB-dependent Receptor Plug Domain/TonB dependent receptor